MSKEQGHSEEGTIFLYTSKSFPLVQLVVPENSKDLSFVQNTFRKLRLSKVCQN